MTDAFLAILCTIAVIGGLILTIDWRRIWRDHCYDRYYAKVMREWCNRHLRGMYDDAR